MLGLRLLELFVLNFVVSWQRLEEVIHSEDVGHDGKVFGRVFQGALVHLVDFPTVVDFVLEGIIFVGEDICLLAEVVHELELHIARPHQPL